MKNKTKAIILGLVLLVAYFPIAITFVKPVDYGVYITSNADEQVFLGELKQNISIMLMPAIPPIYILPVPVISGEYWEYTAMPSLHVFFVKSFFVNVEPQWSVERAIFVEGQHIGNYTWTYDMVYPWILSVGNITITVEREVYDGGFYLPDWWEQHNMTGDWK